MELIEITERAFECELTQLEKAIKTIRETVGDRNCYITVTDDKMHFADDYGNDVADIIFR